MITLKETTERYNLEVFFILRCQLGIVDLNDHIERNNRTLQSGTKIFFIQNADQNHGPSGIT